MKKVLASVLAGSMVLGMASMANAAVLKKSSGSNDYDFVINAYEPKRGGVEKYTELAEVLDASTIDAINEYSQAYKDIKTLISDSKATQSEFQAAAEDLMKAYEKVYNRVDKDSYLKKNKDNAEVKDAIKKLTGSAAGELGWKSNADSVVSIGGSGNVLSGTVSSKGLRTTVKSATVIDADTAKDLLDSLPTPGALEDALALVLVVPTGAGAYVVEHRDSFELQDVAGNDFNLYTYGDDCDEITIRLAVAYDEDLRVDVASGKVTVSRKLVSRTAANKRNNVDLYDITVKAAAGVRDFELDDYKIEFDCHDANLVFYLEGDVAYSDYREVAPDERYINKESTHIDDHTDGCVYNFSEVIDEETRIICNDYVDLLFKGNYGTDYENLRVMTDDIKEVEDFFQDYDIDYYDFIGLPKFAKDITVRVDADSDSYIYEFDKKTGDVVDITDECDYTSDGWTFKRKSLKTYVVLEEPYEGGNVRADKEPVDDEPTEPDDTDATGSKPNPGTGAMPF